MISFLMHCIISNDDSFFLVQSRKMLNIKFACLYLYFSLSLSLVCLLLPACSRRYFSRGDPVTCTPADYRSPKRITWVNALERILAKTDLFVLCGFAILLRIFQAKHVDKHYYYYEYKNGKEMKFVSCCRN